MKITVLEQVVAGHAVASRRGRKPKGRPIESDKAKLSAMKRAEEVVSNLDSQFPSFVRQMLRSHVTIGFWLGLPSEFAKSYLPKHDIKITLVGENGEEYLTNFLAYKGGLSGGWKGFSLAHKLVEGDVLVFQLVTDSKFKVYIIRANDFAEVDGALALLNLDPLRIYSGKCTDMGSIESFTVAVNGLAINSELSTDMRSRYYKLCCSQKAILHDHLIDCINCKFLAGIIYETVIIADAIRSGILYTSRDKFELWDKSLSAFEQLGMNVGFLRSQLKQLLSFSVEPEEASRYRTAALEEEIKITLDRLFGPEESVVADNVGVSRRGRKPRGLPTDSIKANVATVKRAEGVQSNLDPQFPSFVKHMLRSHVTLGFWLGLPSGFCKSYLPDHDVGITLVGENKEEYLTNFLVKKGGLSGGWRGFSIAHKIVEGDVVVFQLVTPYKFKIHIPGVTSFKSKMSRRRRAMKKPTLAQDVPKLTERFDRIVEALDTGASPQSTAILPPIYDDYLEDWSTTAKTDKTETPFVRLHVDNNVRSEILMFDTASKETPTVLEGPVNDLPSPTTSQAKTSLNGVKSFGVSAINNIAAICDILRIRDKGDTRVHYGFSLTSTGVTERRSDSNREGTRVPHIVQWTPPVENPTRIGTRVYITRANDLTDVNGALSLVNLQAPPIQSDSDNGITENPSRENPNALQLALKGNSQSRSPPTEEPGNDSEEVSSGVLDGIRPLETLIEFKNVKTVENFTIAVNGLVIDSEISDYVRAKYYGLCCSQKAFLHDHIIEGINCKLVAGIICETVNIADAIRASKLSTSQNDFKIWDKSLKAFEQLGLNVGFLRARIKQLVNFSKSQQTKKSKRYEEAILGRSRVKNEIKSTEEKLLELHETLSRFDNEIETLEMEMGNHGMKFHAKASAPWC
ncbi:hypothetical protein GIB67_010717 [Kingdonia uniflora]|uniref:TF-B3 domain-containing protein n=1 Tax=Kingdonia uniflora TaxID=39325 RepID=A0A7J7L8M5_9MAGN|nr:hypothetical protein GIB67_010717 [Kingdonia uniflora]